MNYAYTHMIRIHLCVTRKSCSRTTRVRADGHVAKDGRIDTADVFNGTLLLTLLRCTHSPPTVAIHYYYYYYYIYYIKYIHTYTLYPETRKCNSFLRACIILLKRVPI